MQTVKSSKVLLDAQNTIRDQADLPPRLKRTASRLFAHEVRRGRPPRVALRSVLTWMDDQRRAIERARRLPTPTQRKILQLLIEGKNRKQAAYHLRIGHVTVRQYCSEIVRRMQVDSLYQAIAIGVRDGWLKVDGAAGSRVQR